MDSLWPWVKFREAVVTLSLALVSAGGMWSADSGTSYAGESAVPPGVSAKDVEYKGQVVVGGEPVKATITSAKKKAVLLFDGTAGQRVSIGFNGASLTQFKVTVYQPNGGIVSAQQSAIKQYYATMGTRPLSTQTQVLPDATSYLTTGDSTGNWISASEINGSSIDLVELPVTGAYTILLDPAGDYTGSVTVDVSSELSGEIMPHGPAVPIALNRPGQNARYTFSGTSGQVVSLQLSDVTIRSGTVSIIQPDGTLLSQPLSFAGGGVMIPGQALPTSGTYAVLVDPDLSYIGRAKLALYNAPELTGTITDQVTVTPALTVPGQRARYTFNGTAGQWVNLGVTKVSIPMSTVLIMKPDGSKWESTTIGPSGGSLDPLTALPVTGTYSIVVVPVSNYTGSMTLALSSPITATIGLDGPAVPVSITKPGQTARYTFNGKAGQWVNLGLTSVSITSSSVTLMTSEGTILASTAVGTAGGGLEDQDPLPTTGTYTILVDPVGSYTGNMTLTLSTEVSDSIKMNTAPRPITLSRPGQNGRYTFSGTTSQQATIKVTNNKLGNVTVSLYGPNGILQAGMTSSASSFTLNPVTLASTDTYTVTINPVMADTGSIQLQVSNQ
ncbi:hypothetical protein [Candidatus Nitrospira nitrificans]|uniref:Uncharacterized protein n=1 Tax=Candidatus Nitrospira nitrificans TaxID=1742973 RepID=A0A0S4L5H7_9BACT|nr:hypothetical protein [Candidatus Nitrospira nitrificans]CUS31949.1 exported hypothetical protein [Candidatus Nitrospira nitrificans]